MVLDGELSLVAGEAAEAEERFRAALKAAPSSATARVGLAKAQLHQLQDEPDDAAARKLGDAALETIAPLGDEPEAQLIRLAVISALDGDHPNAEQVLATIETAIEAVPAVALDAAPVIAHFAAERAVKWLERAAKEEELRPDALYEIGCVHAEHERREPQVAAWRETWELDGKEEVPPLADSDVFEEMAQNALEELPEELHARLERVAILIDDRPSLDMVDEGVDPRSLGLFTGTPMPEEQAAVPSLTHLHIFKRNLERVCQDLEELEEQVRVTVLLETAHFFGLDEDEVAELGLE